MLEWLGPMGSVLVAYLLGSLSFSYLIVRGLKGIDIRTVGSGNAGATNVLRTAGRAPALAALLLDAGKGLAAVVVARGLGGSPMIVALVAIAAVLGHMYPVFFGFRGGKGVATAAGTLGSLAPMATLLALGVFVFAVGLTRYVSLGSVLVALTHPLLMVLVNYLGWSRAVFDPWLLAGSAVIGLLIAIKHRDNIQRLLAGNEKKIGQTVSVSAAGSDDRAASVAPDSAAEGND